MLEYASQGTACDFDALQELWNVPSWINSIASCGRVYMGRGGGVKMGYGGGGASHVHRGGRNHATT